MLKWEWLFILNNEDIINYEWTCNYGDTNKYLRLGRRKLIFLNIQLV